VREREREGEREREREREYRSHSALLPLDVFISSEHILIKLNKVNEGGISRLAPIAGS